MFPNRFWKVLCSVSVRTNVPAMKVTPRMMARAVRARRSLWARRPLTVTRHTSGAQHADTFQHGVSGWVGQLVDDEPVGKEDHTVSIGRAARVVSDHDDGLSELVHGKAQEGQH